VQLLSRVNASALAAQPLAVEQMRPGELDADLGAGKVLDRLPVQTLCRRTFAQQRPRARLDPERPFGAAGAGSLREPIQGVGRDVAAVAPDRRLDQL